jgi:Raf kinase inhibitor-like YbhB/YbcL family protein
MTLTSTDFKDGTALPVEYVYTPCGGQNVSPQLSWSGAARGTDSYVLTVIDVGVKPNGWSHWIVFGIPAELNTLPRGMNVLPPGAKVLANDFGNAAYDGPCPPPGTGTHRYEFTIWAIPKTHAVLGIAADAPATALEALIKTYAIDHATLTATATR